MDCATAVVAGHLRQTLAGQVPRPAANYMRIPIGLALVCGPGLMRSTVWDWPPSHRWNVVGRSMGPFSPQPSTSATRRPYVASLSTLQLVSTKRRSNPSLQAESWSAISTVKGTFGICAPGLRNIRTSYFCVASRLW